MIGADRPAAQQLEIFSGCPQAFEATKVSSDQPWLALKPGTSTVPMKLALEVNPEGLQPGEYEATIRITVQEAFYKTLEIPVTFTVVEPPPAPAETDGFGRVR